MSSSVEAIIQCFLREDSKIYPSLQEVSGRCPRKCLQKIVSAASETFSLLFLVGFELEFYLLDGGWAQTQDQLGLSRPCTVDLISWCSSQRLHGKRANCLRACMLALERAGIIVERGHAEGSFHQFEISTGPLRPIAAIDAFYASRDVIKKVAMEFNFHATFMPKPILESDPSGLHLHLSIHRSEDSGLENTDRVQEQDTDHFLAGILNRLPSICAISMPSSQSYLRGANEDTMGEYVAWGKANHSVPLNEVAPGYWEIRSLDCTANVYLAIATYIAAGLLGIQNEEALPCQDPGTLIESLSLEDRVQFGIIRKLPISVKEALDELNKPISLDLEQMLGHPMINLYREVKEAELETMKDWSFKDARAFYLFHF